MFFFILILRKCEKKMFSRRSIESEPLQRPLSSREIPDYRRLAGLVAFMKIRSHSHEFTFRPKPAKLFRAPSLLLLCIHNKRWHICRLFISLITSSVAIVSSCRKIQTRIRMIIKILSPKKQLTRLIYDEKVAETALRFNALAWKILCVAREEKLRSRLPAVD